jgi:GAF domain-containing protein
MIQNSAPQNDATALREETRLMYRNWREKFVMPLLLGMLILGIVILIPAVTNTQSLLIRALFIAAYISTGIVTAVRFSYTVRISVFLFSVYTLGLGELLRYGILGDGTLFFFGMIVFAVLLLSPRAGIIASVITVVTLMVAAILMESGIIQPIDLQSPVPTPADWFTGTAMPILFGVVVIMGFQRLEKAFFETQKQIDDNLNTIRDERNNLEKKVVERTLQLHRVNEIGRVITAILDPDELLTRAAHLIGDEFECYYTAIFLTDATGQWAELKAATGEAGKVLLENKHHADINENNPIGTAIRTRQVCIVSDSTAESQRTENPAQPFTRFSWHGISISTQFTRTDNPLLPNTRSKITLPLTIGERVIGALEMHSTKENSFSQQDADTYQNMANQVSIALENSRLFREARQSIREMGATQQQYLQGAWLSLTSEQNFEYTLGSNDLPGGQSIEVPLTLRDQVIGQINLSAEEWSPEQRSLIEAIASQAALALENARLVEESQSVAMRERLTNEITAKVWSARTMDSILQTTVRELGRALEAAEVNIELSMGDQHE